ncbi:capping protein inhibiting regulator of actin dynamics-like [Mya arenaria]|uniref:capping protein inhibiting regulator of actin dynamics-like n=1 Tax=Mya arenaria TaxID=6604 RepID=UPI0022E72D0A|nr:capping protein inhibiting regulator of actin dynamics-like [Mya arenaria]
MEEGCEKLYAPRSFLALASPVFKAMFKGNFKESCTGVVKITDFSKKNFLEFLLCLDPGTMKGISGYHFITKVGVGVSVSKHVQREILKHRYSSTAIETCTGKKTEGRKRKEREEGKSLRDEGEGKKIRGKEGRKRGDWEERKREKRGWKREGEEREERKRGEIERGKRGEKKEGRKRGKEERKGRRE